MSLKVSCKISFVFIGICLCFFSRAQIIFTEINFNPTVATCNIDACEFVEIKNNGATTVDISGWKIVDAGGQEFTFPATTTIAPGEYIVIANNQTAFNTAYPGVSGQVFFGVPGLNNNGDNLELRDDNGVVQASASYSGSTSTPGNNDGNSLNLESESPTGEPPSPEGIQGSLPIELISFSFEEKNSTIHLHWRTATEQNNDYMAVERSVDGIKFTELGRVKGAGTTEEPQSYTFVDEKPLRGLNYYRLRQVDYDGAFEYHKTISVLFDGKENGLGVQAFPNPVQGRLQARWSADAGQATTLQVLDMTGRKLAEYQASAGVSSFELPLDGMPAGLYFLKAQQGATEEALRFRKQ